MNMQHIGGDLQKIEQNIKLNTADPIARYGFTQLPNFILRDSTLSIGAKTTYALFLSYAWHNALCFPGQEKLAKDIGMSIGSVNAFIKELEACGLIEIERRGQGRTNLYTINYVVKKKAPKS
jgi:biotin operon repressor